MDAETNKVISNPVIEIPVDWNPTMMLEITLNQPDDFLKVRETLTRIGVASRKEANKLYQSCHILHKQGRYFIVHFKELFLLDPDFDDEVIVIISGCFNAGWRFCCV